MSVAAASVTALPAGIPVSGKLRIGYIDWLRGLACLVMFEVHCYDSWLGGPARNSSLYGWSRFSGILPGPLFLFLSGVSLALVTGRLRRKGVTERAIAKKTIRRGAEILALGLLFRLQEFLLGQPWAPWTDLLRVDILNTIGLAIVFVGVFCWLTQKQTVIENAILAAAVAVGIAMVTPPLWTTWRPRWLPWYLESYINGVHTYGSPQAWLFPIFPWAAFAFAGLAVGFLLFSDWSTNNPTKAVGVLGAGGVGIFLLSAWFDRLPVHLYAVYDYWHTSPNYFLARVAILLGVVFVGYAWCQWGPGQMGFSPLIQMGQASLLVYWVHIEFVYGRFSILKKGAQSVLAATAGFFAISAAMVLLAFAKTHWKGGSSVLFARLRSAARPAPRSGSRACSLD
jgi:uncharacterized membrane protein